MDIVSQNYDGHGTKIITDGKAEIVKSWHVGLLK
jgi:hypothetical protein